jgi:hypothetical protein
MMVKTVHSHPDRAPVALLTGVGANVDTSSASTSLNPSTFPLCCGVQGRIYLEPACQGLDDARKVLRSVVSAVVEDHPVDPADAVSGEERPFLTGVLHGGLSAPPERGTAPVSGCLTRVGGRVGTMDS